MDYNSTIDSIEKGKRITEAYVKKSMEIALKITDIMNELGLDSIMGGKYVLEALKGNSWSFSALQLVISDTKSVYLSCGKISPLRDIYFWNGDYSAIYAVPNRDDYLTFASDLEDIFLELEKAVEKANENVWRLDRFLERDQ